jgi:hypothetical protein
MPDEPLSKYVYSTRALSKIPMNSLYATFARLKKVIFESASDYNSIQHDGRLCEKHDHRRRHIEGVLAFKFDPFPGILSFSSSTQAFSSFGWKPVGVNVSSENSLMLKIGHNSKLGPTARFFYNTLVDTWAYLMDTMLELQFRL